MTDTPAPDDKKPPPTGMAAVSPLASAASVAVGFAANWLLSGLAGSALASLFSADFPMPGPDGEMPHPTDTGLLLLTLSMAFNGLVAGLLVGRLAPIAPIVHAGVLAGIFGMFAMTGMDQARGLPGWFAIAFAIVPPAACVLGGYLAKLGTARRAAIAATRPRGSAERVPHERADERPAEPKSP